MGWIAKTALGVGGAFLCANIALLVSAVPAVAGKGAPYMPTLRRSLDATFRTALPRLKRHRDGRTIRIVDLGSGDGRVAIEAARYGYEAVGYEINPFLVGFSKTWAILDKHVFPRVSTRWKSWPETGSASFHCRDLWSVSLSNADVVFVYGLSPIMDRLSVKLQKEAPEALVVSNVFEMNPHQWKKVFSVEETHFYVSQLKQVNSDVRG